MHDLFGNSNAIKKLGIVIFSCLLVILIANISVSSAYVEKQNKSSETNQVYILGCEKGSCFSPCQTIVLKGDTVTWTNQDYVVHTVTDLGGKFDSQLIQPQDSWKHTFDAAGTYNYFCTLHPWMKGTVIVS